MPYIKEADRKRLLDVYQINNAGELNYSITKLLIAYTLHNGLSYQTINDVVGALTCAKDEFNRRVTSKYEDKKVKENGDVYPLLLLDSK